LPIPQNVHILKPSANVSSDMAVFSGLWGGYWGEYELPSYLAVESIQEDGTAQVTYFWGSLPARRISPGQYSRTAKISNGVMVFYGLDETRRFEIFVKNDILHVEFTLRGRVDSHGKLAKVMKK
jgi:hypothetical protein